MDPCAVIPRETHRRHIAELLRRYPVVGIVGARQVGKSTLARQVADDWEEAELYDLEDPRDLARLADPSLALRPRRGLVVIDEVQRRPDLLPLLRVLADRPGTPARFLLLGSASPELLRQGSESLAGRVAWYELHGFDLSEVGIDAHEQLWLRGGFPRSFLSESDSDSADWRRRFIATFLERDLPTLGITIPPTTLRRFWTMLAHGHGQLLNASELGRSFGVADTTIRRYLDILAGAFVVRVVQPWHVNISKRQVKAPRLYLRDSGLLHGLLGLETRRHVEAHPKLGASWEGFALEQVVARLEARSDEVFFWRTHTGAELDLLVGPESWRLGFEFKRSSTPRVTRSMHSALADLGLERLVVVHPGERSFPLAERVEAIGLQRLLEDLKPLR